MLCSRKSEKGKKTTSSSAATGVRPGLQGGDMAIGTADRDEQGFARPRSAPSGPLGRRRQEHRDGRRAASTVAVVSLGLARAGFAASRAGFHPCGEFSLGKNGVVMPISLR